MDTAFSESVLPARPPRIRSINVDDVYSALAQGWVDFRAAPRFGLFFGGVYALAGIAMLLQLMTLEQSLWILPLAFAFPLVGPFAAIGLYEVSRRREAGMPLDWSEILGAVWGQRNGQMPSMAFVVLAGFMVWVWVAHMLVALIMGRMSFAVYSDLNILFATTEGLTLLVLGSLIGSLIALCIFSYSVVAIPMLLDRKFDYVTAIITSVGAVRANLLPMLTWAGIVGATLIAAMVPFFLGLIVALPVLGHATWHLYRKVIEPDPAG